jgi:hypothetical protein
MCVFVHMYVYMYKWHIHSLYTPFPNCGGGIPQLVYPPCQRERHMRFQAKAPPYLKVTHRLSL